MPEVENTNIRVALPGGRKLYVLACVIYGLAAISTISNLRPSAGLHAHQPIWRWTIWLDLWAEAWCIYFLFGMFSTVSKRIEKVVVILTILWFALAIPESLHRLGYSWAQVPGGKWIDLVVITVAAFLVFLRTFQVFYNHKV
ncbi:MAG TPA: hypothetical protein VFT88_03705, partial [Acidobacteriaceae bacterium]|jgi:hypothetical protein|nr:hypothetical protein [Acidobacteriaceae bacterium]